MSALTAEHRFQDVIPDLGYDLPAPILSAPKPDEPMAPQPVAPEPVAAPVAPILLDDDFAEPMARPSPREPRRRSPILRAPILGAVLLGGLIALAIVTLAFVLRPEPTSLSDAGSAPPAPAAMTSRL